MIDAKGPLTPLRRGVLECLLRAEEAALGGTDQEIDALLRVQGTLASRWARQALRGWPMDPMAGDAGWRCSCLINNYNYGRYVGEAVESALIQTYPFEEIIVVDDGSTDGSQAMLEARYGSHPRVRLVFQDNGGQLAAFNAGFRASTGDLLFFLDADDRFLPTKVAEVVEVFDAHPACGMVCHPVVLFGNCDGVDFARRPERPKDPFRTAGAPWSLFSSREDPVIPLGAGRPFRQEWWGWVGSPTSGLVFSREALGRFLPLPESLVPLWRIRADDCLLHGLSIAPEERYYLHSPLTEYRVHGANGYFNTGGGKETDTYHRAVRLLHGELLKAHGLSRTLVGEEMWARWEERGRSLKSLRQAWKVPSRRGLVRSLRRELRCQLVARILGLRALHRKLESNPLGRRLCRLAGVKPVEPLPGAQLPPGIERFEDPRSRSIFLGILEARRLGGLPHHHLEALAGCREACTAPGCRELCPPAAGMEPATLLADPHQYFPLDLVRLDPEEVLLDAGAFTGDTLASFLAHTKGAFGEIHSFEPDRVSFAALQARIAQLDPGVRSRIHTYNLALGLQPRSVRYHASGGAGNSLFGDPGEEVMEVANIRQVLSSETLARLTFIKMDVEGAEMEVLRSLAGQIRERAPLLAVCVYHRYEDLTEIPAFIHRLRRDYHLFLRHHTSCRCETVLYAIPPGRLIGSP